MCLLLVLAVSAQVVPDLVGAGRLQGAVASDASATPLATATDVNAPTVTIPNGSQADVPTVAIPDPTATATPKPKPKPHKKRPQRKARTPSQTWIWAYLTSYCPASAGSISSSGLGTFYGMLANNYYTFGTHVYIPVLGITGVVEDREADSQWNHFDVWSPVCYGTPTGWFKVAVQGR